MRFRFVGSHMTTAILLPICSRDPLFIGILCPFSFSAAGEISNGGPISSTGNRPFSLRFFVRIRSWTAVCRPTIRVFRLRRNHQRHAPRERC